MADPFQSNQAHPFFASHSRLCEEYRTLWCFVVGDRDPFKVVLSLNIEFDVDDLKQVVHTKVIDTTKSTALPKDLILWKLSESELLEPDDTFARRATVKFSNLSEVATKLGPSQKLLDVFPQQLPQDCLHIIVQMPLDTNPLKRPSSTVADGNDRPSQKLRTGELVPDEEFIKLDVLAPESSDFSSLAELGKFVDKSPAIQGFLQAPIPIHLLLRPRRSGKTTLLRMFRDFFKLTSPDKEAQRKDLFKNLTIFKDERFEMEFGKYPVMYLDFSRMSGATMADLLAAFKTHVTSMVRGLEDSGHFQNRDKLPKNQRHVLDAVLEGTHPDSEWPDVLFEMTKILSTLHKKKTIVLIDEYDTPMTNVAKFSYAADGHSFLRNTYAMLLKNNEYLRGALLVGILRIAKSSLLSGLNNVKVFSLGEENRYSTACMFTRDETRSLYDRQNKVKKLPFTFDDLEKWYNGYSTLDGTKLFNPWSVSYALTEGELGDWWTDSGYDATIQDRIVALLDSDEDFRSKCQGLLNGEKIEIKLDRLVYSSLPTLTQDQLWTFIYYAGYLAKCSDSGRRRISVRIPNFEIISQFREWIRNDFERRMNRAGFSYGSSVSLFCDMVDGNFSEFSKAFGEFILTSMPQRIFGSHEWVYQSWVHAFFRGVVGAMGKEWKLRMEPVAGDGRADIFLYDENKGAILEFKRLAHPTKEGYRDHEESLLSKATNEALDQCDTRHYRAGMPKGVITIVEYGIAFLGPYCAVEARMLDRKDGNWITRTKYTAITDEKRRRDTYVRQDPIKAPTVLAS